MANNDGLIIIDDADKVPPAPAGRHPLTPIGGSDFHGYRRPSRRWPVEALGLLALLVLLVAVPFLVWLNQWEQRELRDRLGLIMSISIALVIAAVGLGALALVWGLLGQQLAAFYQAGIVRLRMGAPVYAWQVGRLDPIAQEERAYAFEREGWPHKQYPNLGTRSGGDTKVETSLGPALPEPVEPSAPPSAGILASWRAQGWIDRSGESLVAGLRPDGKPELIDLRDCGYIAVGGRTRSGKTSTVVSWLSQGAIMGWQFVICDKHANKPDGLLAKVAPLERAFALPPARDPASIAQRIHEVDAIGRERLRVGGHHPALFLVVDEYTNMILRGELSDKDLDVLLSIAIEYAGVNVHGIIIGQGWAGNMVGKDRGASQRRAMTHRMIHPCDPAEAAFLLPSGYQKMVSEIRKGQAIYFADEAPSVLSVPFFGPDEVSYAAQHIPEHVTPLTVPEPPQAAPARPTIPLAQKATALVALLTAKGHKKPREAAAAHLLAERGTRVRGGWEHEVKDVARALGMRDEDVSAIGRPRG